MSDPLFWLGFSLLLVAVSLTAVLVSLIPAVTELARAARSAEKLFDTLQREFPPTLEAIRLTGLEISELTDDLHDGVSSASGIVKQVDRSLEDARVSTRQVSIQTRSALAGVKAAWQKWQRQPSKKRRSRERLPAASQSTFEIRNSPPDSNL